ncbi:MAG: cation:proton antiporter [Chloroflexi bacterium]|nr:cation:proton antiporter [Chloroflexota bacterium]
MSHEFLNFVLALVIIITAAKTGGYLSVLLKQPSVLGELLVGLILGPTLLNIFHTWPVFSADEHLGEMIAFIAELGVLLLMMLAGLELHLSELLKSGKVSALAGMWGVILPLGLGWGVAVLFGVEASQALFMGLALAATSVSISAQTLMALNVLKSRVGLALLGAAVFDDILVILALSVAFILVSGAAGGLSSIIITILSMIGYLVTASLLGIWLLPRLTSWIDRLPISQGILAFALVASLLFAWAAEVIGGMAAITGAFMVGLFLARTPYKERIEAGVSSLAYGFFVPVFFVNIGLTVNMQAIGGEAVWFALTITVIAVLSKIAGCGLGARLGGFSSRESLQLGIGMVSRGEVGLIVAAFALGEGLLSPGNFSVIVFMVIVATLVTPPMLRASFPPRSQLSVT